MKLQLGKKRLEKLDKEIWHGNSFKRTDFCGFFESSPFRCGLLK